MVSDTGLPPRRPPKVAEIDRELQFRALRAYCGRKRLSSPAPACGARARLEDAAEMAKLRLGMIGTGVAARRLYLPAFERLGRRLEIVACTNRTRSKAEQYAKLA